MQSTAREYRTIDPYTLSESEQRLYRAKQNLRRIQEELSDLQTQVALDPDNDDLVTTVLLKERKVKAIQAGVDSLREEIRVEQGTEEGPEIDPGIEQQEDPQGGICINPDLLEPEANPVQDSRIRILEGICGIGKSTRMIQDIKEDVTTNPNERYLVVLPILDEIIRYQEALPGLNFREPGINQEGEAVKGTKTDHVKALLKDKQNLLCTHSLFQRWDSEIEYLVQAGEYNIILDEEVNVIEPVPIKKGVIENLKKLNYIKINPESSLVEWNYEESGYEYDAEKEHAAVIRKAKAGSLYCFDSKFFVYEVPHRLFRIGKSYTVMTYMFKGNFMEAYMTSHHLDYYTVQINPEKEKALKDQARELITLLEPTPGMQRTLDKGKRLKPLSRTFISTRMEAKERTSYREAIRKMVYRKYKHDPSKVMITCFKEFMQTDTGKTPKKCMMPRSMQDCYVPMNARGSNKWADRDFVIHMVDHYPEPHLDKYLNARSNGSFDPDVFALSILIQFIYRSAIREGNPIQVLICSDRMRSLFKTWLEQG